MFACVIYPEGLERGEDVVNDRYEKLTLRSESSVVDFCGHSSDENHDSNFSANSLTCPLHCTLIVTLEDFKNNQHLRKIIFYGM